MKIKALATAASAVAILAIPTAAVAQDYPPVPSESPSPTPTQTTAPTVDTGDSLPRTGGGLAAIAGIAFAGAATIKRRRP